VLLLTPSLLRFDLLTTLVGLAIIGTIASSLVLDRHLAQWSIGIGAAIAAILIVHDVSLAAPASLDDCVPLAIRALIAGALTSSLAKLALWGAREACRLAIAPLVQVRGLMRQVLQVWRDRHLRREHDKAQEIAEQQWLQAAPARAQAVADEQERLRQARDDQKRREDARMECELCYALVAQEIGIRFPRSDANHFIQKYMRDDLHPSEVEERGQQLQQIIHEHVEKITPAPRVRSLADLVAWFREQKRQIEAVEDERMRRNFLVRLNERYAEMTSQFMEETQV